MAETPPPPPAQQKAILPFMRLWLIACSTEKRTFPPFHFMGYSGFLCLSLAIRKRNEHVRTSITSTCTRRKKWRSQSNLNLFVVVYVYYVCGRCSRGTHTTINSTACTCAVFIFSRGKKCVLKECLQTWVVTSLELFFRVKKKQGNCYYHQSLWCCLAH